MKAAHFAQATPVQMATATQITNTPMYLEMTLAHLPLMRASNRKAWTQTAIYLLLMKQAANAV